MALKINAGDLLQNRYLVVESDGVKFSETALTGGKRHFRFHEISCILLSPDHKLSFQVGKEVFSIPTKPDNAKHQEVVAAFVRLVEQANGVAVD
jgi:hypothetical protein